MDWGDESICIFSVFRVRGKGDFLIVAQGRVMTDGVAPFVINDSLLDETPVDVASGEVAKERITGSCPLEDNDCFFVYFYSHGFEV
jgi:hypothetical protein